MSDIWNEKNTVCWSPTKFIKEMNKLQALNAELEAQLAVLREAASEIWEADQEGRATLYSKRLSDAIDRLEPLMESRND